MSGRRVINILACDVESEIEDAFNNWYHEDHVPKLLGCLVPAFDGAD